MMSRRATLGAISGVRAIHCTPAAGANINFSSVISKVSNDNDKARLQNLQKVHDTAKAGLLGVKESLVTCSIFF